MQEVVGPSCTHAVLVLSRDPEWDWSGLSGNVKFHLSSSCPREITVCVCVCGLHLCNCCIRINDGPVFPNDERCESCAQKKKKKNQWSTWEKGAHTMTVAIARGNTSCTRLKYSVSHWSGHEEGTNVKMKNNYAPSAALWFNSHVGRTQESVSCHPGC